MKRSARFCIILAPIAFTSILGLTWGLAYIILFGLLALSKVLYLSITFNDCRSAAKSLKEEIMEARSDLSSKGITTKLS